MVAATISRVRMRDLTRLGRSRAGLRPAGLPGVWLVRFASSSLRRCLEHRRRLAGAPQSGQLAPRTSDLMASPI